MSSATSNPPAHEVGVGAEASTGSTTGATPTKYDYDEHVYPRGGKKTLENLLIPHSAALANSHPAAIASAQEVTHPLDTLLKHIFSMQVQTTRICNLNIAML